MAAWMRPWLSNASASRGSMSGKLISSSSVSASAALRLSEQREAATAVAVQLEGASSALVTVTSVVFALLSLYAVFGLCLGNAPVQDLPTVITQNDTAALLELDDNRFPAPAR